tara:strand:- start:450 stop:890 length:441 start_codon:yes stop_codon:yes gene_type:complete
MNINKVLLFLIVFLFQILSFNSVSYSDEEVNNENEETEINLDEEELPAIDPFQSSSAATSGAQAGIQVNPDLGILSGLKLVGVIMGETNKIAVLSSKDGFAIKFQENDKINENIELQEIYSDHLLIKDMDEKFYEVYMNDIIKSVE